MTSWVFDFYKGKRRWGGDPADGMLAISRSETQKKVILDATANNYSNLIEAIFSTVVLQARKTQQVPEMRRKLCLCSAHFQVVISLHASNEYTVRRHPWRNVKNNHIMESCHLFTPDLTVLKLDWRRCLSPFNYLEQNWVGLICRGNNHSITCKNQTDADSQSGLDAGI